MPILLKIASCFAIWIGVSVGAAISFVEQLHRKAKHDTHPECQARAADSNKNTDPTSLSDPYFG